jgi:hypothetical protein
MDRRNDDSIIRLKDFSMDSIENGKNPHLAKFFKIAGFQVVTFLVTKINSIEKQKFNSI